MADILDINNFVDLDVDEEGERGIARLKNKAKRRKGRGFVGEPSKHEKVHSYERLEMVDSDGFGPQKSVEGWILFVTGVHEEASEDDLADKFAEYGVIKSIGMNLDRRTGFLKGYALIEYESFEAANNTREALNGSELLGQSIAVDWCFVKGTKRIGKKSYHHRRTGTGTLNLAVGYLQKTHEKKLVKT